jgi:hypothetical protein
MKKIILWTLVVAVVLVAALYAFNTYIYKEKQAPVVTDYKDAEYRIGNESIRLKDEFSYFGNEYRTDLNADGLEDVVFLITQQSGGSGTFYYVVAALNTERGYIGSDGYFLGDRIAPQNIGMSPNPRHKNVVVVNYADRAADEPMTTRPSVGKSAYLKLDTASMMWGIVEPDFEGESR